MRFGISAAILAQALPVFAFSNNDNGFSDETNIVREHDHPMPTRSHYPLMTTPVSGDETQPSSLATSGRLVNRTNPAIQHQMAKNMKKRFDVKAVGSECDPDVGILTCGFGKVCQADDTSSLGGVCAPRPMDNRRLYGLKEYCEAIEDYDCDCSNLSSTSYTGSFSCTFPSDCFTVCQNVCYDGTVNFSVSSSSVTVGLCYDFDTPYDQKFCFSTSVSLTSNSYDISCELTLDNNKCNSCELTSYCGSWNCLNNGMGSGNFCNDSPRPPIMLTQCYGIDTNTTEWTSGTEHLMSFATACTMGVSAAMVAAYGL